jgi:2-polyprenyl-3-methyl-5-hydroxy-6-metoxy-1,4-benzoquinol methylase
MVQSVVLRDSCDYITDEFQAKFFDQFEKTIDCSPIFGGSMTIAQQEGLYGTIIWDSSMVMNHFFGKYFQKQRAEGGLGELGKLGEKRGKMMQQIEGAAPQVIELGAGVGLAGLVMAKEGAVVTLTDNQPLALDIIVKNADLNNVSEQTKVVLFDWNEEKFYTGKEGEGLASVEYDYIVCSDVVYEHRDQSGLIRAMRHFCRKGEGPPTKIFFAYVNRSTVDLVFFEQVSQHFEVEKVPLSELDKEFQFEKIDLFVMTPL